MSFDFNDDDDFNEGYCESEDEYFAIENIDIKKLIDYWEEKFKDMELGLYANMHELEGIRAREKELIKEQEESDNSLNFIIDTINVLKLQLPKEYKDCNNCSNHNENGTLDNGCYMCAKDLENNYEPFEDLTGFTKTEEEI